MNIQSARSVAVLAMIMGFRMLGLFMVLPVFSLYINRIPYATASNIGIALGVYGLTQAVFQIPFGVLSDKIGRKPVIMIGLLLFILGSLIAALSHSVYGIIAGRAIQGSGAIGSTVLAMVVDITSEQDRSKAMALVGLMIGSSFVVSLILGPVINAWFQLNGIFWATMIFASCGLILLFLFVPKPTKRFIRPEVESKWRYFKSVSLNGQLLRLNWGILSLHCILNTLFIAIPVLLTRLIPSGNQQIVFYLIVMLISFAMALPLIIVAEKKKKIRIIFMACIVVLVVAQAGLLLDARSLINVSIMLLLFFIAFTFLEASLPSWVSKLAPITQKGTAMGIYSTFQFFGIFAGGLIGGYLFQSFWAVGIFVFCLLIAIIWFFIAWRMLPPPYLSTIMIGIQPLLSPTQLNDIHRKITMIAGVSEASISPNEHLVYVKIDKQLIKEDELRKKMRQGNLGIVL